MSSVTEFCYTGSLQSLWLLQRGLRRSFSRTGSWTCGQPRPIHRLPLDNGFGAAGLVA